MKHRDIRVVAVIGVVALIFMATAVVVAVSITNDSTDPTPLVFSLFSMITTTSAGLAAAFYAERVSHDVRNSVLREKVIEGVIEAYPEAVDKLAAEIFDDPDTQHKRKGTEQ